MASPIFSFTRNPSVKVSIKTEISGLVDADSLLVIAAKRGASGGSAVTGSIVGIDNYGDEVAVVAECTTKFGASSQISEMVVAAIKAVKFSSLTTKQYPKIKVLVLANDATSATLAAELAAVATQPMPYLVTCYPATDSAAMTAVKNHMIFLSGNDRGELAQFGSFGFFASDADTATVTPIGLAAAVEQISIAWLRDLAVSKANKVEVVGAAYAAVCASLSVPFLPLDAVSIGGLVPPSQAADWHTPGDAGTVALGLDAGLSPLVVNAQGQVAISRSITSRVVTAGVVETAYYDMQDWQVLYYLRKNIYNLAQQPRYKQAKASIQKLQALRSEMIKICKDLEALETLQYVDKFVDQFTVERAPSNRHAALYRVPVNVIPGFHNKGIELVGTTQFDEVVA